MNKSLLYNRSTTKVGFVENFGQPKTVQEQKDFIFTIANKCREWYEPIFVNQSKYLPVSKEMQVQRDGQVITMKSSTDFNSTATGSELTEKPNELKKLASNIKCNDIIGAILVGAGAVLIVKMLS